MPRKPHYFREFPRALRAAMHAAHLSQAEISRKMEMSPSAMSEWLSGKRCPRINVVRDLARVLRISIETLTNPPPPDNLAWGAPNFQSVPLFQVAAGNLGAPRRLGDIMKQGTRTLWECGLCGNRYEFGDAEGCPNDGEARPGEPDPFVVARQRVEKTKASGKVTREEIERRISEVVNELGDEGRLKPGDVASTRDELMDCFEGWLHYQKQLARQEARG